jgi:hypothetical protein
MKRVVVGLLMAAVFSGTGLSSDAPAGSHSYLYVGTYTGPT